MVFNDGWTIGKPDIIVTMPKDVEIPATGVIDQQNVLVYAHFDKDVWVKAAEVRPGNPQRRPSHEGVDPAAELVVDEGRA